MLVIPSKYPLEEIFDKDSYEVIEGDFLDDEESCSAFIPEENNEEEMVEGQRNYVEECEESGAFKTLVDTEDNEEDIKEKGGRCSVRGKGFSPISFFEKHITAAHRKGKKSFQCKLCSKYFFWKKNLIHHLKIHERESLYLSPLCEATFIKSQALNKHLGSHKTQIPHTSNKANSISLDHKENIRRKPLNCIKCGRGFTYKFVLAEHLKIHRVPNTFQCLCGKEFLSSYLFSQHTCPLLARRDIVALSRRHFPENARLPNHLEKWASEQLFECQHCLKAFLNSCDLFNHLKISSQKERFKCNKCKEIFSYKCLLFKHSKTHLDDKSFACTFCKKKMSSKGSLNQHLKLHSKENPFKCSLCKKPFLSKYHLDRHFETHSLVKEKDFKCEICGRSYVNASTFKFHLKAHFINKQFECHICMKSFPYSINLKRHIKMHEDARLYECHLCGKIFNRKYCLDRHFNLHKKV